MGVNPTEADLISEAITSRLLDLHGPTIGIVQTFYPAGVGQAPAVDVLPVVQRAIPTDDGTAEPEPFPVLPNVPLVYPQGGGCSITWALVPGDSVLIVVLMLDVMQWRLTSAPIVAPTTDQGMHHIAHCVAIPGIVADLGTPMPNPSASLTIAANGSSLALDGSAPGVATLDAGTIKLGAGAVNAAADATKVGIQLTAIATAIGALGGSYSPGSVAAGKVKVE
jgi:hypothetical protein